MTSERFDTYRFPTADLDEAQRFLRTRLGLELRLRDSSYRGTYYALRLPDDGGVRLYAEEGDGVVLELSRLADMDAVRDRLLQAPSPAVLLRSRTIDVPDDDA